MATGVIRANTLALLAGRFISAATSFVVAVMAARALDEDFGAFGAILAAGFIANTVITFGTDTLIVRATSRDPHGAGSDVAKPVLALQLAAGLVVTIAALIAYLAGAIDSGVLIQAAILIPQAVVTVASAVLRGRQQMTRLMVSSTVGGVVGLIASIALLASNTTVWAPILGLGIGHVVTAILIGVQAKLGIRIPASSHEVKALARVTSAFAIMVAATTIASQVALVVLGAFGVAGAAGFAVATRFTEAARLLPASAYGAAFPAMADRVHRRPAYVDWSRRLLYYAGAVTLVLIAFARPICDAVFGAIDHGPETLRILALGIVPVVLRLRLSFELIADGHEAQVAKVSMATAVFILVGSLIAVSAGAADRGASDNDTIVTVVAWLHVLAIILNVVILDRVNRRSTGSPVETALRVDRT